MATATNPSPIVKTPTSHQRGSSQRAVFDIKTPEGKDVRFLKPPLRACGPPVTLSSKSIAQ